MIAKAPVNIAQAALGSTIHVETLDGKKVAVKVPAGTPGGKRFRVRGQGIRKGQQHGDLLVELQVTVPEKLTAEQEKLLKAFAEAAGLAY